ncbi:MAG: hypothetical protein M0P57_00095 [Syntrophales bacterium]|jgi:carbon starvation protein|nr:hypothetical protein [Syntrophales bacterium]MDY0045021.1 carbon starvation CstA family protein [Syntrophales bacterium]
MTAAIVIIGSFIYLVCYFIYGTRLERNLVRSSDAAEAPARRLFDGLDYVPARKEILFGHHFASIVGAAPAIGPALAICWGWAPALLWVWVGNIFIGAVHDYLALMVSVRYEGKSIQHVALDLMGKRTGYFFYLIVFFFLIFLTAVFTAILGDLFVNIPALGSAYLWTLLTALIFGILFYRIKLKLALSTVIGLFLLIAALWCGTLTPLKLSYGTWMWIFFFYIVIASSIPVKVLLQPRDYLNSWLLYAGIAIGFIAAVFAFRGFEVPAFAGFSPIIIGGKPTPLWPAIILIVSFSSISGFHSLVASGTTSKQLEKESDALWVGYGAMLAQGFFSTIVIIVIAGFGYTTLLQKGITPDVLNYENWGAMCAEASAHAGLSHVNLFIQSYATMVKATWLKIIPEQWIIALAGVWIASFVMSALDTTNRVARYCFTEMTFPLQNKLSLFKLLTNRWIASMIPAALGIYLAVCINDFLMDTLFHKGNWWLVIWSSLGIINHLIASIALLTGTAYVAKIMKSSSAYAAMIPAWILWITVTAAMIWFFFAIQPIVMSSNPKAGWGMALALITLCMLNFIFIADFIRSRSFRAG